MLPSYFTGSPWKEHLSNEIIFFQERQDIQKLYTKWWKEKSGGKCFEEKKTKASSLEVENVGGVFVVLIGGTAAGFLIALLEFMWRAFRNSRADKVCRRTEESFLGQNLLISLNCLLSLTSIHFMETTHSGSW